MQNRIEESTCMNNNHFHNYSNYIKVLRSSNNEWSNPENIQSALNINTKVFTPRQVDLKNSVRPIGDKDKIMEITSKKIEDASILFTPSSTIALSLNRVQSDLDEDMNNCSMISTSNCSRKSSGEISFKAKYKTEICKFWELNKTCRFGDTCAFAHGNTEIRKKIMHSASYKTKKCKQFFEFGFCLYGSRCQFLHEVKEQLWFSYKNALRSFELGISPNVTKRLFIFESLSKINEDFFECAKSN